jgi:hypothetical protein
MKEIPLTQGKVALVDDEDFDFINQWKWSACKSGKTYYATRKKRIAGKDKGFSMHRVLLGIKRRYIFCDHKDGNGLDNRRANIRISSRRQNQANKDPLPGRTSKFMGVSFRKDTKKWQVAISYRGHSIHLGTYSDEILAAKTYNKVAIEVHGEFARLNVI